MTARQTADLVSQIGASGPGSLCWCFLRLEQLSAKQGAQDSWGARRQCCRCFLYRQVGSYTCVCVVCICVFVPVFSCGQGVWGSRSLRKGPARTSSPCKQEVITDRRCPLGPWKGPAKRLRLQAGVNSSCARPHLRLTQPRGAGAQGGHCGQMLPVHPRGRPRSRQGTGRDVVTVLWRESHGAADGKGSDHSCHWSVLSAGAGACPVPVLTRLLLHCSPCFTGDRTAAGQ